MAPTTDVAILRSNLGHVLRDLGDLAGARGELERALAIVEAALGPDHPDAVAPQHLGNVLRDPGTWPGPAQYERALAIGEATWPRPPGRRDRAQQPRPRPAGPGDLGGARAQFERALAISEATLGPDHPEIAIAEQARVAPLGPR